MTPAEHRFSGPAGDLCWFEWGKPGEGPSLLLLHATGFHARCWDRVVEALPQGLHVVAVDLRGHGRSYRPASLSDWGATAADVLALVEALFPKPVFAIGHSMGAAVAARVAALAPDRFERLLLIDPVLMPHEVYEAGAGALLGDPAEHPISRRRNTWDSPEQMIERFAGRAPYSGWKPEVLADYCRFGLVTAPDGASLELGCPPLLEASAYMGAARLDPYPLFAQVTCPVTVLRAPSGERASAMDFSLSPTWPGLAGEFPNARDLYWSDVTHFIPMEAPERVAALIVEELG